MLDSDSSLTEILSQQIFDYLVCEIENRQSLIDPYPYAAQGIIIGLFLSTIFWFSILAMWILVF